MNSRFWLLLPALLLAPLAPAFAGSPEETVKSAIQADRDGDHEKALQLFTKAAGQGDAKAMTAVGLKHYTGEGTRKDFCAAFDWFKKAMLASDADAFNNIGVMFREGECVKKNRKVAYLTFLYIHMNMLGSESTQMRTNKNLRREMVQLGKQEMEEALCYTFPYYRALLLSRGDATEILPEFLPGPGNPSFKDARWWSREERGSLAFSCPGPWGTTP